MIYDEIGTGGIEVGGCALVGQLYSFVTAFGIGDVLYNVAKARRGTLEKVVIKSIRVITTIRTLGASRVLYEDTFNALWNQYDLVTYGEAQGLAVAYWSKILDEANRLAKC